MGISPTAATPHRCLLAALIVCALLGGAPQLARAQTTVFTYQGQLTDAGAPANGNYDLQFALFDAVTAGTQIGAPLTRSNVAASSGVFTVQLDFGVNAFPGADRFLQIGVRPAGGGSFTTLAPRQQISSTPYAIRTLSAATADALSGTCTACVQDAQIKAVAGSKITGTIPVASVPAGSGNYIQNTTTQQAGANFNVGGNGTIGGNLTVAGTLNANVSGNFVQNRTTPQTNANFDISGNGTLGGTLSASKVGIGTTTPATALDVRGNLTLDAGADPIVYTSTSTTDQNRYLDLINSPAAPNASGLKAGGVLVADSYGYASPAENDLIVKGNVGVGIAAPESKFHIAGRATALGPFRGVTIDQTITPLSDLSGYTFQVRTTAQSGLSSVTGTDFLVDGVGNVGIGTASPSSKLEIAAQDGLKITGSGPYLTLRDTENNNTVDSYIQGVNGDLVFIPQSFHLLNSAAMVIQNGSGNVGIGTSNPMAAKLEVQDTNAGTAVDGTSTIGSGVFGQSTAATGWGVYGQNVAGGYAMYADGNAGQARDKGGWVKAMALVTRDGSIARCYNSSKTGAAASTPPCGFFSANADLGMYDLDFQFRVDDRFVLVTPFQDGSTGPIVANLGSMSESAVEVFVYYSNQGSLVDAFTDAPFFILVF